MPILKMPGWSKEEIDDAFKNNGYETDEDEQDEQEEADEE